MFQNENILAVVMCGGGSTRMGKDKGLLVKDGVSWANLAFEKLSLLQIPTMISINQSQIANYSIEFHYEKLIVDDVMIAGPLGGLLSIHRQYPKHDIIILACDMIDVSEKSITHLYNFCTEAGSEYDFIVYHNENQQPEPLLGWYSADGLAKIYKYYLGNMLEKFSMKYVLEIGNTFYLPFPNTYSELRNYNTI
jgi:molybdenum cofactor guanylyltransferase